MSLELQPDCERCCGLCCVAPAFARSPDFALDKAPGVPCPNLTDGFRCNIHDRLRVEGFRGCVAYDCFGAGQKVTQVTFGGRDWRRSPEDAAPMFEVYGVMRQLHALLWYLEEASTLTPAEPLHAEVQRRQEQIRALSLSSPEALLRLDVAPHKAAVDALLRRISGLVRTTPPS